MRTQYSVSQKPEILNQTMTHCNEHVQEKKCGQRGTLWDTLWHTTVRHTVTQPQLP